jgi:ubiquinone/menaquinone biosynthesis C-methylase UbiE
MPLRERRRTRNGSGGEVIAGDISATMLDVARRNLDNVGITFEPFDGHELPYPDARFDRVICQLGLAFFEDPGRGLAKFRRVLRPGGRAAAIVNSTPERSLFTRIERSSGSMCLNSPRSSIATPRSVRPSAFVN